MAKLAVIDLSSSSQSTQSNLLLACRTTGCFRVINHGISPSLQADMKAAVEALFDLPDGVKRRNSDVIHGSGYVPPTAKNPLYETFGVYDAALMKDVEAFCALLDAPSSIRETIKTYAEKFHSVIVDVASKLAESMGAKEDQNFGEWPCQFRINKYNFTPDSVGSNGVQIHTDSGFVTLLQEDESVGGLEILDPGSGCYVEVEPVPGTLLVNLGDVAQAWSNGVLHNVKHRVQCKAVKPRFSVALFLLAPKDDSVEAPAAFVDPDHPRLYKTFKYDDYRKLRLSTGMRAGEALSQLLM